MSAFGFEQLVGIDVTDSLVLSVPDSSIPYWRFRFLFYWKIFVWLIIVVEMSHHDPATKSRDEEERDADYELDSLCRSDPADRKITNTANGIRAGQQLEHDRKDRKVTRLQR
jgi:hypothetical protein